MKKKSKRLLSMLLAVALVLTLVPVGNLISVQAASADEIEAFVSEQKSFTYSQLRTLKEYYETCQTNGYEIASMARLEKAIKALEQGADWYDDFEVFGKYVSKTEQVDMDGDGTKETTVGVEPEKAGDIFQTSTNTSNYELVWGGAVAQRMTQNVLDANENNTISDLTNTFPIAYNLTEGITFQAYHFQEYVTAAATRQHTNTNDKGWGSVIASDGSDGIYDKFNLVTLKEGTIKDNASIEVLSGSFQFSAGAFVIYNYIDRNNWSAFTTGLGGNGGLMWVELREGVIYPELSHPYDGLFSNNGATLVNMGVYNSKLPNMKTDGVYTDFEMMWNMNKGCYVLTLTDQSDPSYTTSVDLNKGTLSLSKLDNVYIGMRPRGWSKNGVVTFADAFGELSVAFDPVRVLENRIDSTVPEYNEITRQMLAEFEALYESLGNLDEETYKKISNIKTLTDAIARAEELQREYESDFTLVGMKLDAEDGHPKEFSDYFTNAETGNAVQAVENPSKDAMNGSDKVLQMKEDSYTVEATRGTIATITGKTQGGNIIVKADDSNYMYINVAWGKTWRGDTYYLSVNPGAKRDGSGVNIGDYGIDVFGLDETGLARGSAWFNFYLRVSESTIELRYSAIGEDGKYYYETIPWNNGNLFVGSEMVVGFSKGYWDDLCVNYTSEDAYGEADAFMTTNKYILGMWPYETHLSAADEAAYNELIAGYSALSEVARNYLGETIQTRVTDIQAAYQNLDKEAASLDTTLMKTAEDGYRIDASSEKFSASYRAFTTASNDDSLTQWEFLDRQWGMATVESGTNAEVDTNVIRIASGATLALKDSFMAEKAVVKKLSYNIKSVQTWEAQEDYKNIVNNYSSWPGGRYQIMLYYGDAGDCAYVELYESSWLLNVIKNGKNSRSGGNYEDYPGFDPEPGLKVEIENKNGVIEAVFTDVNGVKFYVETERSTIAKNRLVLYKTVNGGRRSYNCWTYDVDIWNIQASFAQGDWDDDVVQTEIRVAYTGNTYQSPGDVALIRGENIGNVVTSAKLIRIEDDAAAALGYIDRTAYDYDGVHTDEFTIDPTVPNLNWEDAVALEFVHKSNNSLQFIIPEEDAQGNAMEHGIYAVLLSGTVNRVLKTKIVYLNAPVIDYTLGSDGESAAPGTELEIVGENLAPNQNANEDAAAAYKRTKDRDISDVKVKLVSRETEGLMYNLEIVDITSDYNIVVRIPSEIEVAADGTTTDWELYVYNGYGDNTCYSIPSIVKVRRALSEIQQEKYPRVINLQTYGATGSYEQNVTPILQNAISDLAESGGGTIYMPEGFYRLEYTVYVPENIRLIGDGKALSCILTTYFNFDYGDMPNDTLRISSNCEISGIGFYLKRASKIINAHNAVENVTLTDLKFYINLSGWSNNGMGCGQPLVDSPGIYQENGQESAIVAGIYKNLKMQDILADIDSNGISLINSYNSNCYYMNMQDVIYGGGGWQRALFNNSVYKNCEISGTSALQADGVYMYNVKFGPSTSYNREIFVADLSGFQDYYLSYFEEDETGYILFNDGKSIAEHAWWGESNYQIYAVDGNGEGQTRMIVGINTEKNALVLERPFDVPINRNTNLTLRAPREDIYFVDCEFYEGSCPGGFYGGCADVVDDGSYYNYAYSKFYWSIFGDLNWYISNINAVWENTPYSLIASYGGGKSGSYSLKCDGTSPGENQIGLLFRNCDIINMTINSDAYAGAQSDVIIDNNRFEKMEYIMNFSKSSQINGLTFYRNVGSELKTYANLTFSGVNSNGYTYAHLLDEGIGSVKPDLLGDVNGDGLITLEDVLYVEYYLAGKISLNAEQLAAAEVDGDGVVTAMDALYIRYYISGMIQTFPAAEGKEDTDDTGNEDTGGELDFGTDDSSDSDYTEGYH